MRWMVFVSGFVAGVAAAGLGAHLLVGRSPAAALGAPPPVGLPPQRADIPTPPAPPPPPAVGQPDARRPAADAPATPARVSTARPAEAPAVAPPLRLSAEHADMVRPAPLANRPLTLAEQHQAFSLEDRDPEWAQRMEQGIRALADVAWPAPEFELSVVECRRSLCAVFAFGNLPDSATRWNAGLNKIGEEAWGAGAVGGLNTVMTERAGRTTIVTFIRRPP